MEQIILKKTETLSSNFFDDYMQASYDCFVAFYKWFNATDDLLKSIDYIRDKYLKDNRSTAEASLGKDLYKTIEHLQKLLGELNKGELEEYHSLCNQFYHGDLDKFLVQLFEYDKQDHLDSLTRDVPGLSEEEQSVLASILSITPIIIAILFRTKEELSHEAVLSCLFSEQEECVDFDKELLEEKYEDFMPLGESVDCLTATSISLFHLVESAVQGKTTKHVKRYAYKIADLEKFKHNYFDTVKHLMSFFVSKDTIEQYSKSYTDFHLLMCAFHQLINEQTIVPENEELFLGKTALKYIWNALLSLQNNMYCYRYTQLCSTFMFFGIFYSNFNKQFVENLRDWTEEDFFNFMKDNCVSPTLSQDALDFYMSYVKELKEKFNC